MKVKAIKSFVGVVSMNIGEEKDIQSNEVATDLVKAGYVVSVENKPKADTKPKAESKADTKLKAKSKADTKPKAPKTTTKKTNKK